jgi:hypothetical protein
MKHGLAAAELNGSGAVLDLPRLLADLDDRDLRLLGGRLLRSHSMSANPSAARRWITAHGANAADPAMQIGPLSAPHPRSAHAAMRVAYAIGDKRSYLEFLLKLVRIHIKWGRFGQASSATAAIRRLMIDGFNDADLVPLEAELHRYNRRTGRPHGMLEPFVEAFADASAEQAWTLLLRFPQLLSPAGLAYAGDRIEQPISHILRRLAHLGSWAVARELLRHERLSEPINIPTFMHEGITETATRAAMNYVDGFPSDDSREAVEDKGFSDYEFEPSDDLSHEFRIKSGVALGHLIAGDDPGTTAAYAFQFGQHAQQQVEITKVDMGHLDFAIECFIMAVENTDTADPRYVSRTIALSQALELKFTLNRDIRSVESAATRLWEALYCCTPPDSALGRLYYRLSELSAIPHSTLRGFREVPAELALASADWPALDPAYDADLLAYPAGVVHRFTPDLRMPRLAQLLDELTDNDGQPARIWAPDSRPGRSWNQAAELALDLALDTDRSPEDRNGFFNTCETAREVAIARATTVADEAAARFGLVELSRAKLAESEPTEEKLRALLQEIRHCREHEDQLGAARSRRLAEWAGQAHAVLGQTEEGVDEYLVALAIEERIFGIQTGLRHRILSRSTEPSNVATQLSLVQGSIDPEAAVNTLERGRALVFRALSDGVDPPRKESFLPSCDATVRPPETFGRPFIRKSYRTIATLHRLGLRPQDRTEHALPPSATSAEIRQVLEEREANLAYLVAGSSDGGVLVVPHAGRPEFVRLPRFSNVELRHDLPTATLGDETSFRMDKWFERFQNGAGGELWTRLKGVLDSTMPLYLVPCGITAAFPWSACRRDFDGTVRHLASGTHLMNSRAESPAYTQTCQILSAPESAGRSTLDYAGVEVQSIATKWATRGGTAELRSDATVGDCFTALTHEVDVCHIVSHAAGSDKDPLRQGLALANGFVLTTDILGSQARIAVGLIILSSCHSGQAAFEVPNEFISLSSSLVAKGARGTIGNMWAIDDFTSCVMMEVLHDLLLRSNQPAEAVARVQQAGRMRDVDFFTARASLLGSGHVPEDFSVDELFAAGSWAGLHYVGQ